ncbi:EF-P beta-lysylation protein EpmB [Candidatus Profftia tarda]|uniref:EF-P post-translational modification enzyme B n=1 Tax=Candidatus Profftia tarda TaxID=1177216 RepID=A0A8E4F1G3_9ENTR|nr:EF-P beta-lysylation protein EpmB [Candidatus Profftia tarda]CAD6508418.1 L-lysine 2,3-aminomutase [Candidatus Profftia tarda]
MAHFLEYNKQHKEDWLRQLSDVIVEPSKLLEYLLLSDSARWKKYHDVRNSFPLRVPHAFARRMKKGDPNDPLLLQVMIATDEFISTLGYSKDPLKEQEDSIVVPGLLHKYADRALLLVKTNCAVNCRYCFRRYFPYRYHQGNKVNWLQALDYIRKQPAIDEIILSGGDPLMAKDHEISWLLKETETISHIKRFRIHSRLPVVIPKRVTFNLIECLSRSRLHILLVTHINHANEIDEELLDAMKRLKRAGITLLNQGVLLRGVNDNSDTLADLSRALFNAGIMPYYLHLLDKVQGTAHFMVSDDRARIIMRELMTKMPGYMVPKLMREIGGQSSKTSIDLGLQQK